MNELVFKGENGQAVTNSLLVAEKFGKEHRNVIQAIEGLFVNAENSALTETQQLNSMFVKTEYDYPLNNGTNAVRKVPMYIMNRDGFSLLVMGFTGKEALSFKLSFISAFNRMEEELKSTARPDLTKITRKDLAQMLLDSETELERLKEESRGKEQTISSMKERLNLIGDVRERIDRVEYLLLKALETSRPGKKEKEEKPVPSHRTYRRSEFQQTIESRSPGVMLVSRMCRKMRADDPFLYFKTNELFEWLRRKGYLLSTSDKFNLPSEECLRNGYMIYNPSGTRANGVKYYTPYVTLKGYAFFYETIKKEGGVL